MDMDPGMREKAEELVSKVYKQGRHYCFNIKNADDEWIPAGSAKTEAEAEDQRLNMVIQKMREMAH